MAGRRDPLEALDAEAIVSKVDYQYESADDTWLEPFGMGQLIARRLD